MADTLPINNTDVPDDYVGAWQLQSTQVRSYWIQTHRLHASLSIPADRPEFQDRQAWGDFTDDELMHLAQQGGVAGACIAQGDILHRRRQIDYLPQRGDPYLRRMRRAGTRLHDETLDGRQAGQWTQLADAHNEIVALRFQDVGLQDHEDQRRGYLLIVGPYFLFVRDRLGFIQRAESLAMLAELKQFDRAQLIAALDFELSFGTRPTGGAVWPIQHSTLPFREQKPLMTNATLHEIIASAGQAPRRVRWGAQTYLRYWSLDEHLLPS